MSAPSHRIDLPVPRIKSSRSRCSQNMIAWYWPEGGSQTAVNRCIDLTDLSYWRPPRSSKSTYSDPPGRPPLASGCTSANLQSKGNSVSIRDRPIRQRRGTYWQAPATPFDSYHSSLESMRPATLMQTIPCWLYTDPRLQECYRCPKYQC